MLDSSLPASTATVSVIACSHAIKHLTPEDISGQMADDANGAGGWKAFKSISNLEIVGDCVILCGIFSRISIEKDTLESNVPNLNWLFPQRYHGSGAPKPLKVYV